MLSATLARIDIQATLDRVSEYRFLNLLWRLATCRVFGGNSLSFRLWTDNSGVPLRLGYDHADFVEDEDVVSFGPRGH